MPIAVGRSIPALDCEPHARACKVTLIDSPMRSAIVSPEFPPDLQHFPLACRWSNGVSRLLNPLWISVTAPAVWRSLARARHIVANSRFTERVLLERIPACRGRTSVGFVGVGAHFFDVAWQP